MLTFGEAHDDTFATVLVGLIALGFDLVVIAEGHMDDAAFGGSEGAGLPDMMYEKYADKLYCIPLWSDHVRSLNLSTSAGLVLYEAIRQVRRPVSL